MIAFDQDYLEEHNVLPEIMYEQRVTDVIDRFFDAGLVLDDDLQIDDLLCSYEYFLADGVDGVITDQHDLVYSLYLHGVLKGIELARQKEAVEKLF